MKDQQNSNTPSKILSFTEYQREHPAERAAANATRGMPSVKPIDDAEQSGYRSFSPDYYAGIEAGMNRMRSSFGPSITAGRSVDPSGDVNAEGEPVAQAASQAIDELTGHNYDGIQEYDNPTPGWWYAVFVATIIFGGFYLLVYHLAVPPLSTRHATAEARHLDMQFAELNTLETGEPKILAIMNEDAWLERGSTIFSASCAICHSADGSGLIGPNLTDEKYKNISELMDITNLVTNGTDNGSMPAQKNLLNENEIALVTAYVASLRGKDLPTNPNVDPSYTGVPIEPWPTLDAAGNVVPGEPAGNDEEQLSLRD